MKKLIVISAAAFAAFATTGCNMNGGGTYEGTVERVEKITRQTVGGATVVTDYTWDPETAAQTGEIQRTDGQTDYILSDFESGTNSNGYSILTRIRASYNEEGDPIREKLVTTYGHYYDNQYWETKHEEFLLGPGDEETLVRYTTTEWGDRGRIREFKSYEGEVMILRLWNYNYITNSDYTYSEQEIGAAEVTKGYKKNETPAYIERYIMRGEDKFVYEKADEFEQDGLVIEYKITSYDPAQSDPTAVVTNVSQKIILIDIKVEY